MFRSKRHGARQDSGAAAVEFALILPMLILMVIGIYEMGRVVYTRSALESAARAGAQASFSDPSDLTAIEAAANAALTASGITGASVATPIWACECSDESSIACSGASCGSGTVRHFVTVEITKTHTPIFNLTNLPMGLAIDLSTPVRGKSILRAQ